jgi:uncharacterized protein YabN with tetrapyrrole methylase and pyrophosphatase domain
LEYQLSWFGNEYKEDNDITIIGTNEAGKVLINFLESYIGKQLFKDDQLKFRDEITQLFDEVYGRQDKNKDRGYGLDKINKILAEYTMGYEVKSNREPSGEKRIYWEVK